MCRLGPTANRLSSPAGGFIDNSPYAFQDFGDARAEVQALYDLEQADNSGMPTYSFRLGTNDPNHAIVIDPAVVVYAGYLGGAGKDVGNDVAVDAEGNVYIVGSTSSSEQTFPTQAGPTSDYQGGGSCIFDLPCGDAFVAKLNPAGKLVYVGYIGGAGIDSGTGIAVDAAGAAYITGTTSSSEATFPVRVGPDLTHNSANRLFRPDAFVAKIDPNGTSLVYAGYIGGAESDQGADIAVDGSGNAYMVGNANSSQSSFPVTVGPDLTHNSFTPNNQSTDAFVAKVRADGTGLVYAGFIGGESGDVGGGVAVDDKGNAYVTGWTSSREDSFPVSNGPDLTYNGGPMGSGDAYVVKVRSDERGSSMGATSAAARATAQVRSLLIAQALPMSTA